MNLIVSLILSNGLFTMSVVGLFLWFFDTKIEHGNPRPLLIKHGKYPVLHINNSVSDYRFQNLIVGHSYKQKRFIISEDKLGRGTGSVPEVNVNKVSKRRKACLRHRPVREHELRICVHRESYSSA